MMESFIILGLSLVALAHQAIADHCSLYVDVVFIMDSSECISEANFQKEKAFVKQAALKLGVAPGNSRAAIIQFSRTVSVKVNLLMYASKQQFEGEVDGLQYELPRTASYEAKTQIDEALNLAAQDVFSTTGSTKRRFAILLTDGKQLIGATEVPKLKAASKNLRKLGVRLLVVTMGTSSSELDKVLKLVTERKEDVVMADQFNDLLNRLSNMRACGSCVCISGDSIIAINNYKSKKKQAVDDIRFEFKSQMTGTGLIMFAKGSHVDYVSVGYKNRRLLYNVNLGSGEKKVQSIGQLSNGWNKVHITRNEQSVKINIEDAKSDSTTRAITPGTYNGLDIPSSTGYFLGAPTSKNLPSNFVGCIRYFTVDGYEPIVHNNKWLGNQDSTGSMRVCTAADEMES